MKYYFSELKSRGTFLFVVLVSTILSFFLYKDTLLFLLVEPCTQMCSHFIFTNATEVLSVYVSTAFFFVSQFLGFAFLYQAFVFVSPALFIYEYKITKCWLILCFLFWLSSWLLTNSVLVPICWEYSFLLQEYLSKKVVSTFLEAKLNEYILFYAALHYLCFASLQLFNVLLICLLYYNFSTLALRTTRKLFYSIFFIFATVCSPPDVFSQCAIGIALIFFYELFLLMVLIYFKLKH